MADLLRIEATEDGWMAFGTREQLLGAELCTPAHFPEGRKRSRCRGDVEPDADFPDGWWNMQRWSNGVWRLCVRFPHSEIDACKEAKWVRERALYKLERLPLCAESWRAQLIKRLDFPLSVIVDSVSPEDGFSFAAGVAEIRSLVARIRLVASNAPVTMDPCAHAARVMELQQAASVDLANVRRLRAPLRLVG